MAKKIPVEDKLSDIQRVATELGKAPTVSEYRDHGEYSIPTVAKGFDGSFVKAREAAGVCEGEIRPNSREDLLSDIERVADVVDREPSKDDYKEHGEYALSGITYRFESWISAKKEAGVYDGGLGSSQEISREMVIRDIQSTAEGMENGISQSRYNQHGKYTEKVVKNRFDTWLSACELAGVETADHGPKDISDQDVIDDIRSVGEQIKDSPSKSDYNRLGEFSYGIVQTRFDSWSTTVRKAGFEPNEPGAQSGENNGYWKGGYEPYYGPTWYPQRRKARDRDGFACVACELSDDAHKEKYGWELEVHHIRPIREFDDLEKANRLENLITLCRKHHREYEELPANECEKLKES